MHSMKQDSSVSSNNLETQLEQLNEAARWLEEHNEDAMRRSGVFILPPTVVPRSRRNYALKRVFDFFASLIAIILLSPILITIALIIKLTSKGPVIYRSARVGQGGVHFTCYKFRSMRQDADDRIHRENIAKFQQGEKIGTGANQYKINNDPRVTSIGRILRATSLDELPQFFNVLKGDMSIVGPRPPLPYEVEQYRYRHRYRLLVKPGITGIWQVYGRSRVDFETLISMDLHYVTDGTFWLDLKLIFMTIPVMLSKSGGE